MKKQTIMIAALACALVTVCARAQSRPSSLDFTVALAAGQTAVTQDVALVDYAFEVDRIVLFNDSTATCAVSVASADVGVSTVLKSFALGASSGTNYIHRTAVTYGGSTAYSRAIVRDLKVTVNKATNAVPLTIRGRIFGYGR
ncbi:MAG TPA: hypothetical protein PKZ08_05580 [Vicinamibacterales bacterium]|nr:hypothetical protein [Vicinamibacterales bacterium]